MTTFRPLASADIEPVLDLWEALLANGEAADGRFAPAPDARSVMRPWMRETWTRSKPFPHGWVAERDSALVGMLSGFPVSRLPVLHDPLTAQIGDLFVAESARGSGVGSGLVSAFVSAATASGFERIEVNTLMRDERAVNFWKSQGFTDWMVRLSR